MPEPFNGLTPKQAELLACLAEECSEVTRSITKILRHGLESCHPVTGVDNLTALERELGDLMAVYRLLIGAGLVNPSSVWVAEQEKSASVTTYLHHFNDE